ncbi:MAG: DUF5610 domain-containing protein [bacterium]
MQSYQGLQDVSASQNNKVQSKNKRQSISAKWTGFKQAAASLSSGATLGKNMAGPMPPLEALMSQVSGAVGSVAAKNSFTSSLDLGSVYKNTFTLTGYEQSTPNMTPSLIARQTTSLVKGIFQNALSANENLTSKEKTQIFSSLLNGANIGFASAKKELQASGQLTDSVKQELDQAQALTRESLYNYYHSLNMSQETLNAPQAAITSEATQPAAAYTPVQASAKAATLYGGQVYDATENDRTTVVDFPVQSNVSSDTNIQTPISTASLPEIQFRFKALSAYIDLPYIPSR